MTKQPDSQKDAEQMDVSTDTVRSRVQRLIASLPFRTLLLFPEHVQCADLIIQKDDLKRMSRNLNRLLGLSSVTIAFTSPLDPDKPCLVIYTTEDNEFFLLKKSFCKLATEKNARYREEPGAYYLNLPEFLKLISE